MSCSFSAVEYRVMHDKPPDGGAPLPGGPHGAEHDGPDGEIEVGAWRNDNGVVSSKLQERSSEPRQNDLSDAPPHGHAAGGRDKRQPPVCGQSLADFLSRADDDVQKPFRKAAILYDAGGYRVCCNGAKRDLARWLPDDRVAGNQRQHGVPGPYGNREVERRDNTYGPSG